jgi:hypothetical protein
MLPRSCSVVLALSIAGCAVVTDSSPDDSSADEASSVSRPEPGPPYWVDDGYRDPCVFGEVIEVQGHLVRVPVPCAADELDKGDPLPLELDRGDRSESLPIAADPPERGDPAPFDAPSELRAPEVILDQLR